MACAAREPALWKQALALTLLAVVLLAMRRWDLR
jgi:hypothetical protein